MTQTSVLVVEDESIVAMGLQDRLERLGYAVSGIVDTGEAAVSTVVQRPPDVVLMDIHLAGEMDGIAAAEEIRTKTEVPVIYLTAFNDSETVRRAAITEPMNYLSKPCQDRDLRIAVEIAMFKHQAERERRRSQQLYETTLQSIADAIVITDAEGRVILLNGVAEQLTGWTQDEAAGRHFSAIAPLVDAATGEPMPSPAATSLSARRPASFEQGAMLRTRLGKAVPVEGTGAPIFDAIDRTAQGAVVAFRDVAEHQMLQERLRKAEKLESLGLVAAGIAHNSNNLLTVVLGSLELAKMSLPANSPAVPFIEEVDRAADRLAKISQQMLTYTAAQYRRIEPVSLSEVVQGISPMLARIATGRARLDLRLVEALPRVQGDVSLVQQAVTNLVTNGVEAAADAGGEVRVETAVRRLSRDDLRRAVVGGELPEGDYVALEVSDNGPGMGPAVLRSMFDPFFTTRFTGRGLGLAAVHGIARMHNAALFAESAPGAGTTVRLLFQPIDGEPA